MYMYMYNQHFPQKRVMHIVKRALTVYRKVHPRLFTYKKKFNKHALSLVKLLANYPHEFIAG